MKISSILSFFGLAALLAVILPSSAHAAEETALRGRRPTTNLQHNSKKIQPAVRALQELSSEALIKAAPLDSGLANHHPQQRRELQIEGIIDWIVGLFFGGGNDGGDDGILGIVSALIGVLIPALLGGESDNLVLDLLKAILPLLLGTVLGAGNPIISIIIGIVDGILSGEEDIDDNRQYLADQLEALKSEAERRR